MRDPDNMKIAVETAAKLGLAGENPDRGGRTRVACRDVVIARHIEPDPAARQVDLNGFRRGRVEMKTDPAGD